MMNPEGVGSPGAPTFAAATTAALAQLSIEQGHQTHTAAGRLALCAMALAVVVRVAVKLPADSPERRAAVRAVAELRQVV
jgi:hypothetical protein